MDRLQELFEIQAKQNAIHWDIERVKVDKEYQMMVIQHYVLGAYEQLSKMLNSLDWKKHLVKQDRNDYNAIEQCIDVCKYTFGIIQLLGAGDLIFYQMFKEKSALLEQRWESEKIELTENTRIALFDIDGVIADYESAYENYLEAVEGLKPLQQERTSYSFFERYGIDRLEEEKMYAGFVESGGFLTLSAYEDFFPLYLYLKTNGIKIAYLTARPAWQWKRIYADTRQWLNRKNIKPDILLWGKDKADLIINWIMPAKILFMVEDRDKHAIEVAHLGVRTFLLDKTYNRSIEDNKTLVRIKNLVEIQNIIYEELK